MAAAIAPAAPTSAKTGARVVERGRETYRQVGAD
jgi:hypothetical protein